LALERLKKRIEERASQDIARSLMGKIDMLIEEQQKTNEKLEKIIQLLGESLGQKRS